MRLRLNVNVGAGRAAFPIAPLAALLACCLAPAAQGGAPRAEFVERRLACMGTLLELELEAPTRTLALEASERAVRALEAAEARLSTWTEASELAALNRSAVGARVELSFELAQDLHAARHWHVETSGAFDPGCGRLVAAWGLREGGRQPSATELATARASGGLSALALEGRSARRLHAALQIEEGGFGKGVGLDAALRELALGGATRARLDLGGQIAVHGAESAPYLCAVADPRERDRPRLRLRLERGSLATSGNAERGIEIDGQRRSHLLDPRSGEPAADFGSLSVHAPDATAADCLSTGLFVLGPEAALAYGRAQPEIDVLVLEPIGNGRLRARATGLLAARLETLDEGVQLERLADIASAHGAEVPEPR